MRRLFNIIFIFLLILSCGRNKSHNYDGAFSIDSLTINSIAKKVVLFNSDRFATQLDSLTAIFKENVDTFNYVTDTLTIKSSKEDLAELRNGLFKSLYSEYLDTIIMHHYFAPNTKDILRIYLLEAFYSDSLTSYMKIESLKNESQSTSPVEDGDYYLLVGLTYTNDYVTKQKNRIYWLNVACQYSKSEYYDFIACFKANLNYYSESDSIICFCSGECLF